MGRNVLAGTCAGILVRVASLSLASEPPSVRLESMVLSSDVAAFDMKVLLVSEESWQAGFAIGIHWDPAVLDLVDVNLEGTVFSGPGAPGLIYFVNLKPEGRPCAGIFAPFLTLIPVIAPPGPFLNLRFVRAGERGEGAVSFVAAVPFRRGDVNGTWHPRSPTRSTC